MALPQGVVMRSGLMLKGRWMYGRKDIKALIKTVEVGVLKLGMAGGVSVSR